MQYGKAIFYKLDKDFFIFNFSFGGTPNIYYEPSDIIIVNPKLEKSIIESRDIENTTKNGVIIKNDTNALGANDIIKRYSELITESEITLKLITQKNRMDNFIVANDERSKADARQYINKIINGDIDIIGGSPLFESIQLKNSNSNQNNITQYVELIQYYKASLYNEFGINANYNMKRERLNGDEIALNDFALFTLINDMLECRKNAIKKINEKFGLNISVELNEIWQKEKERMSQNNENDTIKNDEENTEIEKENIDIKEEENE